MFVYILVFLFIWALKFVPTKPLNRQTQIAVAIFYPLILLGLAFLWNAWARHLIGWPPVDSFEEFVLAIIIF